MIPWHDLRVWLSGFLGGLAVSAIVAATFTRAHGRALQGEEHALPKRPIARVDAFEKSKIHRA
jgi:hypothetical protein